MGNPTLAIWDLMTHLKAFAQETPFLPMECHEGFRSARRDPTLPVSRKK